MSKLSQYFFEKDIPVDEYEELISKEKFKSNIKKKYISNNEINDLEDRIILNRRI